MSLGSGCIALCAPFTTIAAVLLFMMAHMLRSGNWTFMVLAAKHGWEREAKAATCQRGGLLYLFASTALWALVFLQAPLERMWRRLPWVRQCEDERTSRAALLDGGDGNTGRGGGYHYSPSHARPTRGQRRGGGGGGGPWLDDATEMSALDWAEEALGATNAVSGPASPLGPTLGANTTASPISRRYPDFQRSLAEATGKRRVGAAGKDYGVAASFSARDGAGADSGGGGVWQPARGNRTCGGGDAAGGNGISLNSLVFQTSTPTTLGVAANSVDSQEDMDFMSDVEVDGTRHYASPQLRASGWGMHRTTQASTAASSGGGGAGGRFRASARGNGLNADNEGARAARRPGSLRNGNAGAAHRASPPPPAAAPAAAATTTSAAAAAAAASLPGILTSLWPAASSTSPTAAGGAGRRRRAAAGAPFSTDANNISSDADSVKSKRV